MPQSPGKCRRIRVVAFRGDRCASYWFALEQRMDDEDNGTGPGPSNAEVLLFAGHTGVSMNGGVTIFGFNPVKGNRTTRQLLNELKRRNAFPGEVRDDTAIFAAARKHGLIVYEFDVLCPQTRNVEIENTLALERKTSNYTYGFPNGDGECNCATWVERIGVPLISGRMEELEVLMNYSVHHLGYRQRRFGVCVP